MAKKAEKAKPAGVMHNLDKAKTFHALKCPSPGGGFARPRKIRGVGRYHGSTCNGCGQTVFGQRERA